MLLERTSLERDGGSSLAKVNVVGLARGDGGRSDLLDRSLGRRRHALSDDRRGLRGQVHVGRGIVRRVLRRIVAHGAGSGEASGLVNPVVDGIGSLSGLFTHLLLDELGDLALNNAVAHLGSGHVEGLAEADLELVKVTAALLDRVALLRVLKLESGDKIALTVKLLHVQLELSLLSLEIKGLLIEVALERELEGSVSLRLNVDLLGNDFLLDGLDGDLDGLLGALGDSHLGLLDDDGLNLRLDLGDALLHNRLADLDDLLGGFGHGLFDVLDLLPGALGGTSNDDLFFGALLLVHNLLGLLRLRHASNLVDDLLRLVLFNKRGLLDVSLLNDRLSGLGLEDLLAGNTSDALLVGSVRSGHDLSSHVPSDGLLKEDLVIDVAELDLLTLGSVAVGGTALDAEKHSEQLEDDGVVLALGKELDRVSVEEDSVGEITNKDLSVELLPVLDSLGDDVGGLDAGGVVVIEDSVVELLDEDAIGELLSEVLDDGEVVFGEHAVRSFLYFRVGHVCIFAKIGCKLKI